MERQNCNCELIEDEPYCDGHTVLVITNCLDVCTVYFHGNLAVSMYLCDMHASHTIQHNDYRSDSELNSIPYLSDSRNTRGGVVTHVYCAVMEKLVKIPSGLEILESSSYGRGLFSKRNVSPGTEMLVSHPFVHVVSSSSRGYVCDQCLNSSE